MLLVYSKPGCVQCRATERWLEDPERGLVEGADYKLMDATEYTWLLVELGYVQAPVLYLDDSIHWSGFQPDKLESWRASL